MTSLTGSWWLSTAVAGVVAAPVACARPNPTASGTEHDAFSRLSAAIIEDYFRRHPTEATDLGVHRYDDRLDDYSAAAVAAEGSALRGFRRDLEAIPPGSLAQDDQLDRDQLLGSIDAALLEDEVIRQWARDPDVYSSGITNTAYIMIKRRFAPADERLKALTSRLRAMPAALLEARKNLERPPRVYTEIAI